VSKKSSRTNEIVYEFICNNPGKSTYEISKKLKMTGGRVRHSLSMLHKMGLVTFKWLKQNPRIRKLCFPISAVEILPKSIRKELKNIKS
jgi:predicted transcriptional regulator